MSFTNDTIVEECLDVASIPSVQYNFVSINEVGIKDPESIIGVFACIFKYLYFILKKKLFTISFISDVIGICKSTSDVVELTARASGRQIKKREITLVDQSASAVCFNCT